MTNSLKTLSSALSSIALTDFAKRNPSCFESLTLRMFSKNCFSNLETFSIIQELPNSISETSKKELFESRDVLKVVFDHQDFFENLTVFEIFERS